MVNRNSTRGRLVAGYTLVELMVVLAVLGFLTTMAFFGLKSFDNTQSVVNAQKEFLANLRSAQTRVNNGAKGASSIPVFVPKVNGLNSYFIGWTPGDVMTSYAMPDGVTVSQPISGKDVFVCISDPNISSRPCTSACGTSGVEQGIYCYDNTFQSTPLTVKFQKGAFKKCITIEGSGYRVTRIYEPNICT